MKAHSGAKTPLHTQPGGGESAASLDDLLRLAVQSFKDMTPHQQRRMVALQRASFVRGMTTPCEHGVLDFEQCGDCREPRRTTTASAVGMEAREAGRNEPITPHTGEEK